MADRRMVGRRRHGAVAGRVAALVALAVTAAGCWWPVPGQGPDRRAENTAETVITADSVDSLHLLWTTDTAGSADDPVTSDAGVHVSDGTATYGFGEDGGELWTVPLPPELEPVGLVRQVLSRGDQVLVSYGYGNLGGRWVGQWVDAATGAVEAQAGPYDSLRGDIGIAAGITYHFGTNTPVGVRLTVSDLVDPSHGWSGFLDIRQGGSGGAVRPPTVGEEAVFFHGRALDPATNQAGEGVWAFPLRDGRTDCGPAQATVFACAQWFTPLPATGGGPVVVSQDLSTLYVGTGAGQVYALDAHTGAVQWSAPVGAGVTDAPALAGGWLYVPTGAGTLAVLPAGGCGAAACAPAWTASTGAAIDQQPAVAGGLVFTGSADGSVDAFPAAGCGAATCDAVWSGDAGAPVTGAPALNKGRLYVGTQQGLVAFGV